MLPFFFLKMVDTNQKRVASGITANAVSFHINTLSAATFSEIQEEQPVYVLTVAEKQTHVALMRPVRYNWAIEV